MRAQVILLKPPMGMFLSLQFPSMYALTAGGEGPNISWNKQLGDAKRAAIMQNSRKSANLANPPRRFLQDHSECFFWGGAVVTK